MALQKNQLTESQLQLQERVIMAQQEREQHQLHLQTISTIAGLTTPRSSNKELADAVDAALLQLLAPFLPVPKPSPIVNG